MSGCGYWPRLIHAGSAAIRANPAPLTPIDDWPAVGYSGLTRQAYELDLRQYASWCSQRHLRLFQARRTDIECFARDLKTRGRARATITRRLCTSAGFYRYAVEEDLLRAFTCGARPPPRLDYESQAGLDRNELGALLVAAGLGPPAEHALIALLALNGLRVSEATGANIEALGVERGHRTLVITRKGGKVVTVPLAPRTLDSDPWVAGRYPVAHFLVVEADNGVSPDFAETTGPITLSITPSSSAKWTSMRPIPASAARACRTGPILARASLG